MGSHYALTLKAPSSKVHMSGVQLPPATSGGSCLPRWIIHGKIHDLIAGVGSGRNEDMRPR